MRIFVFLVRAMLLVIAGVLLTLGMVLLLPLSWAMGDTEFMLDAYCDFWTEAREALEAT